MFKNNREDIYDRKVNYSFISLLSSKIRIGVIGGGKASLIKIRHFINLGCYVEVISKEFNEEIIKLTKNSKSKLKLIKEEFNCEFIKDKHIILIAIDDINTIQKVKKYCEENFKIYINSSNFKEGMGVVPVQKDLENISFGINTIGGNPKGAVLLSNKVNEVLKEYDEFIGFTTDIRNKAKILKNHKKEIINFIGTEDFKYFYDKGKSNLILNMYFSKEIVEYLLG
ncbi:NAD(P)-dependent oxidoreductase [Clostridium weizhouense]|uniref:precorrin-2 dehydrogenase n=1 Tax=Clostridium weizhouense TaxID=2859781 RepID=A0ABS7AKN7_9CLOT|nr:NAD(P)-dependent oxidoreductase [Clostridium weizhouense]MBW6409197.1 NAD(P)-dependent oxidoreductase [Clostridium weizhouense]